MQKVWPHLKCSHSQTRPHLWLRRALRWQGLLQILVYNSRKEGQGGSFGKGLQQEDGGDKFLPLVKVRAERIPGIGVMMSDLTLAEVCEENISEVKISI